MTDLERFAKLKKRLANAQREADKAQGAHKEILRRLKSEFGCTSIEDAQRMLAKLEEDERVTAAAFKKTLASFEKRWSKHLP